MTEVLAREDRPEEPGGCLACNEEPVRKWFHSVGVTDEHIARMHKIPTPRHRWSDVVICDRCSQAWLLAPEKPNA